MTAKQEQITDFLASHGGPFYELQARLGLLRADTLKVRSRAAIFVAIAWGVPLLLGLPGSLSLHEEGIRPYLLDPSAWVRFFIAITAFMLAEEQVERGLHSKLTQFLRAPLLDPASIPEAVASVSQALKKRDSRLAELVMLILAACAGISSYSLLAAADTSSWAALHGPDGARLTIAGWWSVGVSLPLCFFLLFRGLWRHFVWSRLLRKIARLDLRLVATHPDGKGGLGFLAEYPNAYMLFVFGMSSVIAAAIAKNLVHGDVQISVLSMVMAGWLAIVLLLFAYPLSAFSAPLSTLKKRAMLLLGAQATRYHRAAERKLLGQNVVADSGSEAEEDVPDPTKVFETTRKLSSLLVTRSAIVPVTAAALIPFAIAGAAWLPYKEVFSVLKKLVLI
ncbi:hypothetical protein ABUE31_21155 [Mesorhizobium sp. ZMM04-5]|uniref:Transmembrane protein n=1 Tax=Mesorhizobium marinum TaxID=3228790 RepID=A0ABV3R7I3_9HYPH